MEQGEGSWWDCVKNDVESFGLSRQHYTAWGKSREKQLTQVQVENGR